MFRKLICGFFIFIFVGASIDLFFKRGDPWAAILGLVFSFFLYRFGFKKKKYQVASIYGQEHLTSGEIEICAMVDKALADGVYSVAEEQAIIARASQLGVSLGADTLAGKKSRQAAYYRDRFLGIQRQPPMPWPPGFMPESGERLIWVWNASISIWSVNKRYVAGTSGFSCRVSRRFTLRSSGTRGHTETIEGFSFLGRGVVVVTNRALLYSCGGRAERVPLSKIVHVTRSSREIIVQRSRGKPLRITTDDDATFLSVCLLNARRLK